MNAVERIGSYLFRGVYTASGPFHPFGGAVDIIVVEQPDGSFKSSPWYVRFGKFQGVLKAKEKIVNICVNGTEAGFHMYLDRKGEAYFLREVDGKVDGSGVLSPMTSGDEMDEQPQIGPMTTSGDEMDEQLQIGSMMLSGDEMDEQLRNGQLADYQSVNFDGKQPNMITQIDASNGEIVSRTDSKGSRIFRHMFGRKSRNDHRRLSKGETDMKRVNSLKRAEFAADLLEVRWCTNLSTMNGTPKSAARLSASEAPDQEAPKEMEVSDKQQISGPSEHDSMNSGISDAEYSCFQRREPKLQTAHDAENVCANELQASQPSIIDLRGPSCESEASLIGDSSFFRCSSTGKESNREDSLPAEDVPDEESPQHGVSTYFYRETSVSFSSEIDGSSERGGFNNVRFGQSGEEVEVYTEVLYNATKLLSDVNSGLESDIYTMKESLVEFDDTNLGLSRMENSETCKVQDGGRVASEKQIESSISFESTPEKQIERSISFESSSVASEQTQPQTLGSIDTQLLGLDSVESRTQEVIHQNAVIKKFPLAKTSTTGLTEFLEDQSQLTDTLSSMVLGNGAVNEGTTSTPDFHVVSLKVDQIPGSINNEVSAGICSSSCLGNLRDQEHEMEISGDEIDKHESLPLTPTFVCATVPKNNFLPQEVIDSNLPLSDVLEEFLFSDNDDSAGCDIRHGDFTSTGVIQTDGQETEISAEEHEPDDMSHLSVLPASQSLESCSIPTAGTYSPDLTQKVLLNTPHLPKESWTRGSPLSIPNSHRSEREGPCMVGSLPNIRSHIHDLESSDACKHLSHSLDSRTENLELSILRKDLPCSLKSELVAESDVTEDHQATNAGAADMVDTHTMREHEETLINPAVGMGADAASRAFDNEKLDFKKFGDLGPLIVKNDKLVVRMSGQYFPWDVASPIVLGTVSFGWEPTFKLEGMIAVDPVEEALQGKLSRATAPSGGSWRLWPFNLRKPKNEPSVHPARDDTNGKDAGAADNAPESLRGVTEEYENNKGRTPKKKAVCSLVPTPEQLVSLNLKEGQNVITFTFSTAMLGRQQESYNELVVLLALHKLLYTLKDMHFFQYLLSAQNAELFVLGLRTTTIDEDKGADARSIILLMSRKIHACRLGPMIDKDDSTVGGPRSCDCVPGGGWG
ncbi:hypothetical protein ACLOJK_016518 [Asimina triloba]